MILQRFIRWCVVLCVMCVSTVRAEPFVRFTAEGLPGPTSADVNSVARRAVLKAFLDRHPDWQIDPFAMPAIEGSAMDSGPLMAIAAGIPPHVMYVNFRQSSTYLAQGFLEPLEILLARVDSRDERVRQVDRRGRWLADPSPQEIAAAVESIRNSVPKAIWPVIYRRGEGDDRTPHIWAIPLMNNVMALLYRRDLFVEAGLNPDDPPSNWDEFLAAARKLTNPKKQQFGYMSRGSGQYVSWGLYNIIASNGVEAVRERDDGTWHAAYGNREAAEALYFCWQLIREPFVPDGYDKPVEGCTFMSSGNEGNLKWERGEIGMQMTSMREELLGSMDPELIGVAPIPASPRGTFASQFNAEMYGVFTGSTPRQKLAAIEYIRFVCGDEGKRIRTDVYVRNGYGKFVSPLLLEKYGYDRLLRQVPQGWQDVFRACMDNGVPEPYGKNTQNIYRWMSEPINAVLLDNNIGKMDRDGALATIENLLRASANRVDEEVLGHVSPQTMRKRRLVAVPALVITAVAFTLALVHVWRSFARASQPFTSKVGWRKFVWGYVLLAPALLLTLWWAYAPLGMGLGIAFFDYQLVRDSIFVGVDNFANVLFDEKFWYPLFRTFYFVALTIGLGFWPPILLAILLQEVPTTAAKYVFRTIFYLPAVVSGLVVMFLWKQLYTPNEFGVLNQLLMSFNTLGPVGATFIKWVLFGTWMSLIYVMLRLPFKLDELSLPVRLLIGAGGAALLAITVYALFGGGWGPTFSQLVGSFQIKPLKWTGDPALAMLCVVLPHVWAASGPGCILYLAALKSVPDEYYEAADIDGASHWQKVFYIVLPGLKYLIVVQFVGAVTGAFKGGVEMIMVMTGGGPNNATNILALEMFNRVFMDLKFGVGTVMAWLLGALLIGFTAYQLKMLSKAEFRAAGATKG